MNTPDVLVLDEPTLGLDSQTRAKIWEYITHLKEEIGMSLLLTTHYMDEAEQLSDYVYIIDHGKTVKEGRTDELIGNLGNDTVRLQGTGDISSFIKELEKQAYMRFLYSSDRESMHLGVDSGQKRVPGILTLAARCGFAVREVAIDRPNLGDVFFGVTGREIRER